MFFKIGVLKNFANFTRKHLCCSLFNKKRLRHRCFPVKCANFLRTPLFTEDLQWLLQNNALNNLSNATLSNLTQPQYMVSTQRAFTCSKLTIETLEEGVKYVKS